MEKMASEIQKERIREIEGKAEKLLDQCTVATLTSYVILMKATVSP